MKSVSLPKGWRSFIKPEEEAATKIQAGVRGVLSRKRTKKIKDNIRKIKERNEKFKANMREIQERQEANMRKIQELQEANLKRQEQRNKEFNAETKKRREQHAREDTVHELVNALTWAVAEKQASRQFLPISTNKLLEFVDEKTKNLLKNDKYKIFSENETLRNDAVQRVKNNIFEQARFIKEFQNKRRKETMKLERKRIEKRLEGLRNQGKI